MKSLVHHSVDLSAPQMRKLVSGGAVTLKPSQFREGARTSMAVLPATARKIATAMRKMKGLRVSLKPEEDLVDVQTGGSLKSFGKTLKRGITKSAKDVGDALSSEKALKTYRKIGQYGLDIGVPAVLGLAGEMLGGPAGAAAAASLGSIAADQVHSRTGFGLRKLSKKAESQVGLGFFKGLKKVTGINKKDVIKTAKRVGKAVVENSAEVAGEAITAYTGNPMLGAAAKTAIKKGGEKAIDSGSVKKGLKAAKGSASALAKDLAIEYADDYVDKHLKGDAKKYAEKALAGEYPSAKDLIMDYGKTKAEEYEQKYIQPIGGGRLVSMRKLGMGSPYVSAPYRRAMKPQIGDVSMVGGSLMYSVRPMTDIQTLSPVASTFSAQMSPFVAGKSPQMSQQLYSKSGGSFLPAGTRGGSFVPAG